MSQSSLLSQLQIDRKDDGPRGPDRSFPWWILGGLVGVIVVAVLRRGNPVPDEYSAAGSPAIRGKVQREELFFELKFLAVGTR